MANPNKAKGTLHETQTVNVLLAAGIKDVRRVVQTGALDSGDIHVGDSYVLQAKNWRDISSALREGVDGAERQAKHAKRPFGFAVIKRPRKGPAEAYVAMPLRIFAELLKLLPK